MKKPKPTKGYFFGLNEEPMEKAYQAFLDDCIDPYETREAAIKDAEAQRQEGNFMDDSATVQVYYFEIRLMPV